MTLRRRISMALACAGMAFFAASVRAEDGPAVWTRLTSPDQAFSAEVPCTEAEVRALAKVPPDMFKDVPLPAGSRLICGMNGAVLLAGVIEASAAETRQSALYDQLLSAAKADKTGKGVGSVATIDGRRAFLNREEEGAVVAQTGFIEVSRAKVVLGVVGFRPEAGLSIAEQRSVIDRFYGSIKVAAR